MLILILSAAAFGQSENQKAKIAVVFGLKSYTQTFDRLTNNEAEYKALLKALEVAKENDEILTDSQLLVGQLTKNYKVKAENLIPLYKQAKEMMGRKRVKLTWIPREQNLAGKILEKI